MTQIFNKRSEIIKRRILRNSMTEPESLIWLRLKNKQIGGHRFRRQFSIGRYVADFYCPELKLVIEIDGSHHNLPDVKDYDIARDNFLKSLGIKTLRFSNDQIFENIEKVVSNIAKISSNQ